MRRVNVSESTVDDAVWTYEEPYEAVAAIQGHLAIYLDTAELTTD